MATSICMKFSIASLFRFCFLSGSDRGARAGGGGDSGPEGPRGDLAGLVPPSLGLVPICSFPRNSLSLAGAPRAAGAPAPR